MKGYKRHPENNKANAQATTKQRNLTTIGPPRVALGSTFSQLQQSAARGGQNDCSTPKKSISDSEFSCLKSCSLHPMAETSLLQGAARHPESLAQRSLHPDLHKGDRLLPPGDTLQTCGSTGGILWFDSWGAAGPQIRHLLLSPPAGNRK